MTERDIVERLRYEAAAPLPTYQADALHSVLCKEAADEIEWLRNEAEALERERAAHQACVEMRNEAEAENERLRAALTKITEAADKASLVPGLDVATALVFDELSRIAAATLANEQSASGEVIK